MKKCVLAVLSLAAVSSPAFAHAILIDSVPAANAMVPAGHEAVVLHFNSRIDRDRSRLTLIAPDKSQTRVAIAQDGPPDEMSTAADVQPGAYTIRWQVLAVDGHITRGDLPFTVAAP